MDTEVDIFGRSEVSNFADRPRAALERFYTDGLVTFSCGSRGEYRESISHMGEIIRHRDSGEDGVTVVEYDAELALLPGYTGLSNGPLRAHTDSSGVLSSPRGLALMCESHSSSGGESVLIDGYEVAEVLQRDAPAAYEELSRPDSVLFRSGDSTFLGSVFAREDDGRLRVRLRLDRLGYFNHELTPHISTLFEVISSSAKTLQLDVGQGYIIDNHRFLHGRRAFEGSRRMLRLLFEPR